MLFYNIPVPKYRYRVDTSVAEPCHFAKVPVPKFFVHGSGSGSGSGSYPQILSYFFYKNSCRLPWFWFLLSSASCMCRPVSRQRRFSLIFFCNRNRNRNLEQGYGSGSSWVKMIRFRRFRLRFRFRNTGRYSTGTGYKGRLDRSLSWLGNSKQITGTQDQLTWSSNDLALIPSIGESNTHSGILQIS
jgi:hypothetical protein